MARPPVDISVPGDKSLSHRALMLAALASGRGESRIRGLLDSADVRSTAECLRRLGVPVPPLSNDIAVPAVGAPRFRDPVLDLDCGNSGTTARLLAGVVAGAARTARFVGDASLSKRPMKRVAEPLAAMGARITFEAGDGLPMRITGAPLTPIAHESARSSAQIKSAILLAAVAAGVGAVVREPILSRDHTERMLRALGVPIESDGGAARLAPGPHAVRPFDFDVPGDPSSAAFFAAWALLAGRAVRTNVISVNATRTGFFEVIRRAGATVSVDATTDRVGEPVGRMTVGGVLTAPLTIQGTDVPAMIDELPLVACLGACGAGDTRVTGAAELRVKESDRIHTVVSNLRAIGADADELPDGFSVRGARRALRGRVITQGDHRIAMAFGVLGALPGNDITVDDRECVSVSFPSFWSELARVRASTT